MIRKVLHLPRGCSLLKDDLLPLMLFAFERMCVCVFFRTTTIEPRKGCGEGKTSGYSSSLSTPFPSVRVSVHSQRASRRDSSCVQKGVKKKKPKLLLALRRCLRFSSFRVFPSPALSLSLSLLLARWSTRFENVCVSSLSLSLSLTQRVRRS